MLNLGPLILLALIVGEVVTAVKLSKQRKRIDKLEGKAGNEQKKES